MKKRLILILTAVAIVTAVAVYWACHPTHYKYNDVFIIGSDEERIVARYGEFYRKFYHYENGQLTHAEYLVKENEPEWIMSYDDSVWFLIYFEDGIAVDTDVRIGNIGG